MILPDGRDDRTNSHTTPVGSKVAQVQSAIARALVRNGSLNGHSDTCLFAWQYPELPMTASSSWCNAAAQSQKQLGRQRFQFGPVKGANQYLWNANNE